MRLILLLLVIISSPTLHIFGQTRIITGKVIDENLETVVHAEILNSDKILLTTTDINGKIYLEIPIGTKSIQIRSIGYEQMSINLIPDCQQLDIILMSDWTYDYITLKKVDRLRMKRFKKLTKLHLTAFQNGLFTTDKACYNQTFIPYVIPR